MTIFKSRQVNTDPQPFVNEGGVRWSVRVNQHLRFDPRPEFDVTRDPRPWEGVSVGRSRRYEHNDDNDPRIYWMPRRDHYDTPVNPILVEFREALMPYTRTRLWWHAEQELDRVNRGMWPEATLAQIDHARRVLTRLAAVKS